MDKEWVLVCDAVLRLSGESKGADIECTLARKHGIPVFAEDDGYGFGDLVKWRDNLNE
jgi:hypothetical protein